MSDDPTYAALDLLSALAWALGGLVIGGAISVLLSVCMRLVLRRRPEMRFVSQRLKLRQRITLLTIGALTGISYATLPSVAGGLVHWRPGFMHAFLIAGILLAGYVATGVLGAFEDGVVARMQHAPDSPHLRRIETQMQVFNRVGSAVIWLCVLAGVLYTFQGFRLLGTSLFASAGLLSIVAGLAAQSTLSNLFAGLQLAFTDAIRVGDAVVVQNGTMGRIEEITITYVVVRVWDDRRMILPSTYFTTTAFENWSRRDPELLGTVEFDLDWMVPIEAVRAEFKRQLSDMSLWDGRVGVLQVTDSTGGNVRLRILVSAANSSNLFDLRCDIREGIVTWLQDQAPYALPRVRLEPRPTSAPPLKDREELIETTKREWEEKQAADESQDAIPTQFLDLTELLEEPTKKSKGRKRPLYGSTRHTGWSPSRKIVGPHSGDHARKNSPEPK